MQLLQRWQPLITHLFYQSLHHFHYHCLVLRVVNVQNLVYDLPATCDVAWYYVLQNVYDQVLDKNVGSLKNVKVSFKYLRMVDGFELLCWRLDLEYLEWELLVAVNGRHGDLFHRVETDALEISLNGAPDLIPDLFEPAQVILKDLSDMSQYKELAIVPLIRLELGVGEVTQSHKKDFEFGLVYILQIGENLVNMFMICIGLLEHIRQTNQIRPLIQVVVELNSESQQWLQALLRLIIFVGSLEDLHESELLPHEIVLAVKHNCLEHTKSAVLFLVVYDRNVHVLPDVLH